MGSLKKSGHRVAKPANLSRLANATRIVTGVLLALMLGLGGCKSVYEFGNSPREQAILLHGLGRTDRAMSFLQHRQPFLPDGSVGRL